MGTEGRDKRLFLTKTQICLQSALVTRKATSPLFLSKALEGKENESFLVWTAD